VPRPPRGNIAIASIYVRAREPADTAFISSICNFLLYIHAASEQEELESVHIVRRSYRLDILATTSFFFKRVSRGSLLSSFKLKKRHHLEQPTSVLCAVLVIASRSSLAVILFWWAIWALVSGRCNGGCLPEWVGCLYAVPSKRPRPNPVIWSTWLVPSAFNGNVIASTCS
jgi:hypothetical protein